MAKSISELLRLRKDSHSLVTLNEMKAIWDACISFANQVDKLSCTTSTSTTSISSQYTTSLRTTLLSQAKLFVERRHESNMSSLAAALDSERWIQCEVSTSRQDAITRLCTGLSIINSTTKTISTTSTSGSTNNETDVQILKYPELEIEGTKYKVVWSCLLLIEMVLANIATALHFQSIATNNVNKISELFRLFNTRTTQLVLGAGAIHSHAKLKSINAKHLSLVTQCLGVVMAIIPHIRAMLMTQLPKKQHMLLNDLDQIRKEYNEHNEKVLNKFVSIIGGIVEHSLAKTIPGTDFDARALANANVESSNGNSSNSTDTTVGVVSCCMFLDGIITNIRKMHQVLYTLLPPEHLIDTFSRIFAFIDTKVPILFITAANIQPVFQSTTIDYNAMNNNNTSNSNKGMKNEQQAKPSPPTFVFPKTDAGKHQFILEVETMTKQLNQLDGIRPWDFAIINVIERQLDYTMNMNQEITDESVVQDSDLTVSKEISSSDDSPLSTVSSDNKNENGSSNDANTALHEENGSTVIIQENDVDDNNNNGNDNDHDTIVDSISPNALQLHSNKSSIESHDNTVTDASSLDQSTATVAEGDEAEGVKDVIDTTITT
jgi:vacuolar protein sorting-associated protein 54